jgi:branched-chain amino acid transport system ATP-binding protein
MAPSDKPLLELKSISKTFGGLTALKNVSLRIERGEICGVIGPNGAGKSTLFSVIAGSAQPSSGQVLYRGMDVSRQSTYKRTRTGIIRTFQLAHIFESMTVEQNVVVGAEDHASLQLIEAITRLGGYWTRAAAAYRRAAEAMDVVGISDLAQTVAMQLTFGQQRLVATARAIAARPQLLLLDEPAAGLSTGDIEALSRAVINAREAGATIVIVEHNLDVIMRLCDHIAVMHLGEKIGDGTPEAIRQSERVVEAYLGT